MKVCPLFTIPGFFLFVLTVSPALPALAVPPTAGSSNGPAVRIGQIDLAAPGFRRESQLDVVPFKAVPEPTAVLALLAAASGFILLRRRSF